MQKAKHVKFEGHDDGRKPIVILGNLIESSDLKRKVAEIEKNEKNITF